jgi:hypothetical protein
MGGGGEPASSIRHRAVVPTTSSAVTVLPDADDGVLAMEDDG